jgi:C-terminal processing protease CtpA/Prc
LNASFRAAPGIIGQIEDTKQQLLWGRTEDGIGYINVTSLGNKQLPDILDDVLERLADTWALIVDLRYNSGGNESLGRAIAGRFADRSYVYSLSQFRNGVNHDDLSPKLERKFEPRAPWCYESPVIVLGGQQTMSSAESFYLMLAQCPNVTTMGDRTAGSSGNPRRIEALGNITVNLPRWLDLLPNGEPLDKAGAPPDVPVNVSADEFTNETDPVLQAALTRLREILEGDRLPGWRASTISNNEENGQ